MVHINHETLGDEHHHPLSGDLRGSAFLHRMAPLAAADLDEAKAMKNVAVIINDRPWDTIFNASGVVRSAVLTGGQACDAGLLEGKYLDIVDRLDRPVFFESRGHVSEFETAVFDRPFGLLPLYFFKATPRLARYIDVDVLIHDMLVDMVEYETSHGHIAAESVSYLTAAASTFLRRVFGTSEGFRAVSSLLIPSIRRLPGRAAFLKGVEDWLAYQPASSPAHADGHMTLTADEWTLVAFLRGKNLSSLGRHDHALALPVVRSYRIACLQESVQMRMAVA